MCQWKHIACIILWRSSITWHEYYAQYRYMLLCHNSPALQIYFNWSLHAVAAQAGLSWYSWRSFTQRSLLAGSWGKLQYSGALDVPSIHTNSSRHSTQLRVQSHFVWSFGKYSPIQKWSESLLPLNVSNKAIRVIKNKQQSNRLPNTCIQWSLCTWRNR